MTWFAVSGLAFGTIYRNPHIYYDKTMVSCRFSLEPIHWYWIHPSICCLHHYSPHHTTQISSPYTVDPRLTQFISHLKHVKQIILLMKLDSPQYHQFSQFLNPQRSSIFHHQFPEDHQFISSVQSPFSAAEFQCLSLTPRLGAGFGFAAWNASALHSGQHWSPGVGGCWDELA